MGRRSDELLGRRADAVRPRAEARRDGARSARSSRRRSPSSRATSTPCSTARASRRRTLRASPLLLTQRHPSWTPQQMKSALMSTAGPSYARHGSHAGGVGPRRGRRPRRTSAPPTSRSSSPTRSRSRSATSSPAAGRTRKSIPVAVSDAGDGAGTWTAEIHAAGCVCGRDRRGRAGHARARRQRR